MKKNKMMRIASVLLVAVLLSTCAISGTFAKYTSTATATATATVAKWDIKLDGNAFVNTATFDLAETWTDTRTATSTDVNVTEDYLAPGTEGSFDFTLQNSSDVVATYAISLSETLSATPDGYTEEQFPVEYSVDGSTWNADITQLELDGTLAIGSAAVTVTVYWRWSYNGNDVIDTVFGTTNPTVTIDATITVTQVD